MRLYLYAPLRRREGILLCTCRLVCMSVCLGYELIYHPQTQSTHPSWVVKEPFWFWGHWIKGQGHRVKYANIIIDQLLGNAFSPFLKLGPLSFLCSRRTLLILGHWVKGHGHQGQMCQYRFWSITRESPYLKLGPHIVSGQQRNSLDVGVTRSKVKVTGVKCAKTVLDCLGHNVPKWISSSYIFHPVLQNICDKNNI